MATNKEHPAIAAVRKSGAAKVKVACPVAEGIDCQVKITANSTVEITASTVNVHAPMVNCDGVVRCQTLITQSVVSPSYTPGARNIW